MRRIEGAQVYPHLLARNVPLWTDQDERTSLMSVDSALVIAGVLADIHQVTIEELGAIMLVQAFDRVQRRLPRHLRRARSLI